MSSTSTVRPLRWIERAGYVLLALPFLTDFMERGRWPSGARDYVTEASVAALLLFYVMTLRRARRRLEQSEENRRSLTTLLVHDMRTPLANVVGTLSYLESHPDDVEQRRWIRAALRSCRENDELMGQLIETDRLEDGLPLRKSPVDVPELLRACAEEAYPLAFAKNINFFVGPIETTEVVPADGGLVRRVLMNLIRNALKYTPRGGRVDVAAEVRRGRFWVEVRDNGAGMSKASVRRLFRRYARVVTGEGDALDGWGLGLYFCRLAVEAHGGRIAAQSREGEGTRVRFFLPLSGAPASAADDLFADAP